jgi:hypothetical protein
MQPFQGSDGTRNDDDNGIGATIMLFDTLSFSPSHTPTLFPLSIFLRLDQFGDDNSRHSTGLAHLVSLLV